MTSTELALDDDVAGSSLARYLRVCADDPTFGGRGHLGIA